VTRIAGSKALIAAAVIALVATPASSNGGTITPPIDGTQGMELGGGETERGGAAPPVGTRVTTPPAPPPPSVPQPPPPTGRDDRAVAVVAFRVDPGERTRVVTGPGSVEPGRVLLDTGGRELTESLLVLAVVALRAPDAPDAVVIQRMPRPER